MNLKTLKNQITDLIKNGFFHVFGASTINKIVSLCSSIFIVRVLSRDDYGMYAYVINIVNIFMLFNGLGTLTGMLQYGCMTNAYREKKNAFFLYGMEIGFASNIIISIVIIIYAMLIPQRVDGANRYLIIAAFVPIFRYINDSIPTYLRTDRDNKKYGLLYSMNSILLLIFMIIGAVFFEVTGTIVARYITNSVTITIGIILCNKYRRIFIKTGRALLVKREKIAFLKYSIITCFNNAVSQLLYNIDIMVIGIVISSTISIASYKVATTIPFGLSFISTAVITYVYPAFVKNKEDFQWIKKNYKKLIIALGCINGVIAVMFFAFAPLVITIIFGKQYISSVLCFRILIIGYWIASTFRIPGGNVLDMLLKVKINFGISVVSGILNIILDIFLIKSLGSVGAAIATTSIYIITAIISNYYLFKSIKEK